MKQHLFELALGVMLLAGCQSNPETDNTVSVVQTDVVLSCYQYQQQKDSVSLRLEHEGVQVKGELKYNLFEKDENRGTLKGTFAGDTLWAEYTFQSEGTESVREVVFLKQDAALVEGYGEMNDVDGKMQFTDKAHITFGNMRLQAVPCEKVPL